MNENFITDFDEVCEPDLVFFCLDKEEIVGYFSDSPIEQRMISKFDYKPNHSNVAIKPYRAIWMISNSELSLMYVNGIINGVNLCTSNIVPEYPDDKVFFCYQWYSGQLRIKIQQPTTHPIFNPYFINERELLLSFENGILKK